MVSIKVGSKEVMTYLKRQAYLKTQAKLFGIEKHFKLGENNGSH